MMVVSVERMGPSKAFRREELRAIIAGKELGLDVFGHTGQFRNVYFGPLTSCISRVAT